MKLRIALYFLFVLFVSTSIAQVEFKLVNELPTSATDFTTDNLNNIYLIENNEIVKLNFKGDTLFTYSNKILGNINCLDVNNTLRPLLFFKQSAQIVVTDNTLSAQQLSYKLEELDLYQTQLVATSLVDNGIWIYDQELFQLIKVNTVFERIYQSGNLAQILQKENLSPTQLIEHNGNVLLTSPSHGVLVFDIYGSYLKTVPITNIERLQVFNGNLYYQKEGKYYTYNLLNFEETEIILPVKLFHSVRIEKDHLIVLLIGKIAVYSIHYN